MLCPKCGTYMDNDAACACGYESEALKKDEPDGEFTVVLGMQNSGLVRESFRPEPKSPEERELQRRGHHRVTVFFLLHFAVMAFILAAIAAKNPAADLFGLGLGFLPYLVLGLLYSAVAVLVMLRLKHAHIALIVCIVLAAACAVLALHHGSMMNRGIIYFSLWYGIGACFLIWAYPRVRAETK